MTESWTGASTDGVRVGVVVPAAGSGERMGGARKPFLEIRGEPMLLHALRPLLADPRVVSVIVALSPDDAVDPPAWLIALDRRIGVVSGGCTRGESVARALAALPEELEVIAVHDAARPLVSDRVVGECLDVASGGIGAVAGSPAVDTLKTVDAEAFVRATPDRATLWHAHTPQAFPAESLRRAYGEGGRDATDDATLVERTGLRIRMIDDGGTNLKVTRLDDVPLAETILRSRSAS